MNTNLKTLSLAAAALALVVLGGCSTGVTAPDEAVNLRARLNTLQSDPQLSGRAPVAMHDAELAVSAAEVPQKDPVVAGHLIYIANHKIEIARAMAEQDLMMAEREDLDRERTEARLASRSREANAARDDAEAANAETALAHDDVETANAETASLQREIAALKAKPTDKGLVVTLSDLTFASGSVRLNADAMAHLDKIADFLNHYPDRQVRIEGHTDSVGSVASNLDLSQRRAEAVRAYLMTRGIDGQRLSAVGLGASYPVADNTSAAGRKSNRRVELTISSGAVSSN